MLQYHQLRPNLHLITNDIPDRYKIEYNLNFSAGGAWFEQDGEKGVSHLLEHCLLGRTEQYDFYALKDYLFSKNIYCNAATGTLGMYITLSGHRQDSETMLDLLLEFGFDPTLEQSILDREREIVLREISERSGDPNYRLYWNVMKQVYKPESRYMCEVLGLPEDVSKASLETFDQIRNRILEQSHFVISVAGSNIEIDKIKETINNKLSNLPHQKSLAVNYQPENLLQEFKYRPVVSDLAHEHGEVSIYLPCPVSIENRATRYFLQELFLRATEGVLYNRLRNELGMIYHLQSSFDASTQSLNLELSCEIRYIKPILDEVKKLFSNFDQVFQPSKAAVLREVTLKKQQLTQDDPQRVVNFMVDTLTDWGMATTFAEYIQELKQVSDQDIQALYQSIQDKLDGIQTVVISNKPEIETLEIV